MDEVTLRRAQRGDPSAFEALVTPHEGLVWRVCWRYTQNREDALDCAQEAMVKAWRAIGSYRGECALETWLYRIAASCCLDHLRRRKRHEAESADALQENGFDPPSADPLPEEKLLALEEHQRVRDALSQLSEDMRTPLVLSAVEGLRYEDIAARLNVAPGTVKSRINRARLKLAQILSQPTEQSARPRVQHHERRAR